MLVLSRKQGQSIDLPECKVVVRVLGIGKSRVQLGIDAPPELAVLRSELRQEAHSIERSTIDSVDSIASGDSNSKSPSGSSHESESACASDSTMEHGEVHRILDELVRLEAELSAIAELAAPRDRLVAGRVAGDAIQRIEGISRSLRMVARENRCDAQPLAELVRVRAEVLERLRQRSDTGVPSAGCVRQSPLRYHVKATSSPVVGSQIG